MLIAIIISILIIKSLRNVYSEMIYFIFKEIISEGNVVVNGKKITKITHNNAITIIKYIISYVTSDYNDFLQYKKADVKVMGFKDKKLRKLAWGAIYILYFYAQLNQYLYNIAKIIDLDKDQLANWNFEFNIFSELNIFNHKESHSIDISLNIINYPYYFNKMFLTKETDVNIFKEIFLDEYNWREKKE